jgi:hypothetical protein
MKFFVTNLFFTVKGCQGEEDEMGGACSTNGGEEERV